jgi:hypothetical protein
MVGRAWAVRQRMLLGSKQDFYGFALDNQLS